MPSPGTYGACAMMRFPTALLMLSVGLSSSTVSMAADTEQARFAATVGMSLGQSPQTAAWLAPLTGVRPSCLRESHYRVDEDTRRFSLGGTHLASPGLIYKFFDDRLWGLACLSRGCSARSRNCRN